MKCQFCNTNEADKIFYTNYMGALYQISVCEGSEHLLWALAKEGGKSARLLKKYGLDDKLVEEYIRRYDGSAAGIKARAIQISGEADEVLGQAQNAAKARGYEKTGPEDILAGILATAE